MKTTTTQTRQVGCTQHELAVVAAMFMAKDEALGPEEAIEEARKLIEAAEEVIKEAREARETAREAQTWGK